MNDRKHLIAVVPPHAGGRRAAAALASRVAHCAEVTAVESVTEVPDALARAHVVVTALAPVTAADFAAAPRLEFVQCTSHGFDYVDLAAARARGVTVATIGSSGAEHHNVAEHTFALILALAKQIVPAHNALARAEWTAPGLQRSLTELHGKTLGLIGFGAIGQEVAVRAAAFGMTVLYDARRAHPHAEQRTGARRVSLDDLLRSSDYISLHVPLNAGTRNLLDAERIALLKPTAFVVNTARGAVVDQEALADALIAGRIAGAGLDVFDPEPPTAALRLLRAPNVVLSPHLAGVTRETVRRIAAAALENVAAHLDGTTPKDIISRGR
ncbi:2-hydroxyacid dehydrogenase [Streptacidiphilus anmyonensis]|uniref:2-hydroxyacid dehydrogenase n=1 Tax=Streptacidiphilus anmyonensis TaxID=405782 RepID=UPI0005A5DF41|nr:2-hydroxyacid dehydrogenase [Streptacidiphilus anmyonensis]